MSRSAVVRKLTPQIALGALVASLLGMTGNCKLLGMTGNCKLLGMTGTRKSQLPFDEPVGHVPHRHSNLAILRET
ncbi:MAG TPA: hypothetical protein VGK86_08655, partial [Thermoanaerobaculia bacterium]